MSEARSKRLSWHSYFFGFAKLASERSTCIRRKVGAVVVRDKMILATGYNGALRGIVHCDSVECIRHQHNVPSGERHELCNGLHAEQNVIIQAAYHGMSINNGVLYCTHKPCSICMKMIINVGIRNVYYGLGYDDILTDGLAKMAGVNMHLLV